MHDETTKGGRPDNQSEVLEFLSNRDNHHQTDSVERIDTHGAMVFLAGPVVYKIKRAVKYPYLDFSTLEKRRRACENELKVNQHNAPQIYNGILPITRTADGSLEINGTGKVIEWAVSMNRFDENETLDKVIKSEHLTDRFASALAMAMVQSHKRAPVKNAHCWIADLQKYLDQNNQVFVDSTDIFSELASERLTQTAMANYRQIKPILEKRGAAGFVRLCHGDAHLGNIVRINNQPVLFDAIEFDDAVATADVLYDLAFLLMDLWVHGHARDANLIFNRYLTEAKCQEHYSGLAVLPFFLMMRAAIRANVTATRRQFCAPQEQIDIAEQAKQYFSAAVDFLTENPPRLIAVGGLSGSGKSTVAANIAAKIGRVPGAVVLRSDVIRKQLFNVPETEQLSSEAYTKAASRTVYEHMFELSGQILKTGHSVIADAVFARQSERDSIAQIGRSFGAPFTGLWCDAPAEVLIQRVSARMDDASDANADVVKKQLTYELGNMSWHKVNAVGRPDQVLARAQEKLKLQ